LTVDGKTNSQEIVLPVPLPGTADNGEIREQTESTDDKEGMYFIISPMVGTFYRSPDPSSPPFVEKGESVTKNQTLCIIEAMKLMNEIEAEYNCRIVERLVDNAEPIEFGQPIFIVEPL